MSDQKTQDDQEMDKVSGGVGTHPFPHDPILQPRPPTHPGAPVLDPIEPIKTNPA